MDQISLRRISIQVSLSGFSFKIKDNDGVRPSGWIGADRIFMTPELQRRYDEVELSLFTPKCALVPSHFFRPDLAFGQLSDVVSLSPSDKVSYVEVPQYGAILLYCDTIDAPLADVVSQTTLLSDGSAAPVLPEMYWLLKEMDGCTEYNKILASYKDGHLYLAVAQGRSLLLANVYDAVDFTTAEYFIFYALKSLQLNPEISTIYFRTPLASEEEMSLYRYFKSVEQI